MKTNITANDIINEALAIKDRVCGSEFPIDVLPKQMQEIARKTNECLGYPLDFIASSLCFAMSVAIGNTHSVKVKEGWTETPILYVALVGKAGTNKSHPLSFAMHPLLCHDAKQARKFNLENKKYQEILPLSKKERDELDFAEMPEQPLQKKFLVSDITQESLCHVHDHNKRGIGLYVDELKSWLNNFNRYNKGSEEEFWLSSFNGKPIIIDRKSANSSISINHTFIGVIGTIQRALLKDLAKGCKSNNGFFDRILFVVPNNLSKKYWSEDNLPSNIIPLWNNIMNRIIEIDYSIDENGDVVSRQLTFEREAHEMLFAWQRRNTDLCNQEVSEQLVGIYSKLEIYIARFALTLQIMRWICCEAERDVIDRQSVDGAIKMIEYFRENSKRVVAILNSEALFGNMTSDKRKLFEMLPSDFSTSDGVKIAAKLTLSKDVFNRFLKDCNGSLLDNYRHGRYRKIM